MESIAIERHIEKDMTGKVIQIVCDTFLVSRNDLIGTSRKRPIPWARAVLCRMLRLYAGHDTYSCAAVLHVYQSTIVMYDSHWNEYMQYIPFRNMADSIKAQVIAYANEKTGH